MHCCCVLVVFSHCAAHKPACHDIGMQSCGIVRLYWCSTGWLPVFRSICLKCRVLLCVCVWCMCVCDFIKPHTGLLMHTHRMISWGGSESVTVLLCFFNCFDRIMFGYVSWASPGRGLGFTCVGLYLELHLYCYGTSPECVARSDTFLRLSLSAPFPKWQLD